MIFIRNTLKVDNVTLGKVYPAKPEIESGNTVNFGIIEFTDDNGKPMKLHPLSSMADDHPGFEFLKEVYAVVVKPFEDFNKGEVVVVDDADITGDDVLFYRIIGTGFQHADSMVLLDRTNVIPGMWLCDTDTGFWVKVKSVDECLWVVVEGTSGRCSPDGFKFAVDGDGDIIMEPMVVCMDNTGMSTRLTLGKRYQVIKEPIAEPSLNGLWLIVNDLGEQVWCSSRRFIW